jgi:glycine hydroxymethyltransferase
MHVIAAKAVAFGEALRPDFKSYIAAVVENAKVLAATLKERGANLSRAAPTRISHWSTSPRWA